MPAHESMTSKNRWKRFTYTLTAPFYDLLVRPLDGWRRESIRRLDARPGEKVLIVGAGTGLDLDHLAGSPTGPRGQSVGTSIPSEAGAASAPLITAIDLTPAMLDRLRTRAERLCVDVDARIMDGHALAFPDASFDAVILHLILAVIPEPVRCLREVARVLRPGGRVTVMDKFVPDDRPTPVILRLLNPVLDCLGTSVDRKIGPMAAASGLRITRDEPAGFGGYYRILLLRKTAAPETLR